VWALRPAGAVGRPLTFAAGLEGACRSRGRWRAPTVSHAGGPLVLGLGREHAQAEAQSGPFSMQEALAQASHLWRRHGWSGRAGRGIGTT